MNINEILGSIALSDEHLEQLIDEFASGELSISFESL
jgi:hypothetical protein